LIRQGKRLSAEMRDYLPEAVRACRGGVGRVHLVGRHVDGAILQELFTREGVGTLVTPGSLESLREASLKDIGGVLQLIEPLEAEGVLVKRGRDLLEREIDRFRVLEHDGRIVGCVALYPFPEHKSGELACLAVDPEYRNAGYGDALLESVETRARKLGLKRLFVLTTRTAHWFIERGFVEQTQDALPRRRQALYNLQRRSKVFGKRL
ncbi:MAG TPA: amino-acid N-acetyltransferase, partial [Pelomicrobium sp.]|nr:amino-acid N-acetyltransferase [Pelomicrobium sp.]